VSSVLFPAVAFASLIGVVLGLVWLLARMQRANQQHVTQLHAHYQHETRTLHLLLMSRTSGEYAAAVTGIVREEARKARAIANPNHGLGAPTHQVINDIHGRIPEA